jgi:hypothetical protein
MLFDLRGSGRRNTVRVIYLALAVLMGGGLVLFGVGGSVGGGLLDAVNSNKSTSSGGSFEKRVKTLQAQTRANPKKPEPWAQLTRAYFELGQSQQEQVVQNGQQVSQPTAEGRRNLTAAGNAWNSYIALNPKHPDLNVARIASTLFSSYLNKPAQAVAAEEVIIDNGKPTSDDYKQLAALAYVAGQNRKADLAAQRAVALAPKAQRKALRQSLQQYKTQVAQAQAQQTATTGGATSSP